MAREKEDYRANLEILNDRYPNYDMLTIKDVMQVTGINSKTTARKHFKFINGRISKAALARYMCG